MCRHYLMTLWSHLSYTNKIKENEYNYSIPNNTHIQSIWSKSYKRIINNNYITKIGENNQLNKYNK